MHDSDAFLALRGFAESYGMTNVQCSMQFAIRVVERVQRSTRERGLEEGTGPYLQVARGWVEEFCRRETDEEDEWFFRTRSLLSRFPRALLATPIPKGDGRPTLKLVPTAVPRPMRQQAMVYMPHEPWE